MDMDTSLHLNMLGNMCQSLLLGSLCRYETMKTSLDLKCGAFIMYDGIRILRYGPQIMLNRDEEKNTLEEIL